MVGLLVDQLVGDFLLKLKMFIFSNIYNINLLVDLLVKLLVDFCIRNIKNSQKLVNT